MNPRSVCHKYVCSFVALFFPGHIITPQNMCFVVLLWCSSCTFCTSQSCRVETPVRFVIHNVAAVQLSVDLNLTMLLWWSSSSFCNSQCCWGKAPTLFVICNVAVVKLQLIFDLFETRNVAVVKLLLVLWFAALLWWSSYSFCNSQCCCGEAPAHFVICNIAVVKLLLVLWFAMLFWWSSYSL